VKAGRNLLYAQSGGVTAVINASAAAVIEAARERRGELGKVLAARDGIVGVLEERLVDTSKLKKSVVRAMNHTPGGVFGSCRFKLADPQEEPRQYERLIEVFDAHDIGCFFYNGGNDSADTALKLASAARKQGFPLQCIAIPKTIDNDLVMTDNCPGFGSVAKYVAVSTMEAGLDVRSMASTSTKVFILEVMGRHAGWIAAASGLAARERNDPPHLILMPEVPFDESAFCKAVDQSVKRNGYCVAVVSEGVRDRQGQFLAETGSADAFGHRQLGGVAPMVAGLIGERLGHKCHWAVSDYLQRSARHIASKTDLEQARAVGKAAVELALQGKSGVMPVIRRLSDQPYRWTIESAPLSRIANREKKLPKKFIRSDGFGITQQARTYLAPLIRGEAYPPFDRDGLPAYLDTELEPVERRLPDFNV
jgi:ATP-dependent phosphofructokinase / diphosphate-dependent phosphofructokinase